MDSDGESMELGTSDCMALQVTQVIEESYDAKSQVTVHLENKTKSHKLPSGSPFSLLGLPFLFPQGHPPAKAAAHQLLPQAPFLLEPRISSLPGRGKGTFFPEHFPIFL